MFRITNNHTTVLVVKNVAFRTLTTKPNYSVKYRTYTDPEWRNARPFTDIPGPTKFQFIKENMKRGKYYGKTTTELFKELRKEYGEIIKFPMFGRPNMICVFDAKNIEKVYRTEGALPFRIGLDTFEYYRKNVRPELFKTGLVTEQGEKWWELRSIINPIMLKQENLTKNLPHIDDIACKFIEKIKPTLDANNELPEDFIDELNKWAFETVGFIALDKRLGIMESQTTPEIKKLIESVNDFFELTYELDFLPSFWKYYKTKKFYQLMSSLDYITEFLMKHVDAAVKRLDARPHTQEDKHIILQQILKINREYAVLTAFDLISGGIDTSASTMAGVFYNLAKNPDKQEILRKEVLKILPEKSSAMPLDSLSNTPYLRACIKESLRLNPLSVGNARSTGNNIVLAGYQIPKNTGILMAYTVVIRNVEVFSRGNEFIPERWLKSEKSLKTDTSAFAHLPFGFGRRACIGKRLAEMEMRILTARFIREFKIEWNYGPIKVKAGLVQNPITPLKYKLTSL